MRHLRLLAGLALVACSAQAALAQVPEPLPCPPTPVTSATPVTVDCFPAQPSTQKIVVELSKPEVTVVPAPQCAQACPQPQGHGQAGKCDTCDKCNRGRFINIQYTKIRNKLGGHGGVPGQQEIAIPAMATAMIPITLQGTQVTRSATEFGLVRRTSATELSRRDIEELAREVAEQLRPSAAAESAITQTNCQNLEKRISELEGRIGRLEQQMDRIVKRLP